MSDIFGNNQPGVWEVTSKSDPRWDSGSQRAKDITLSAGICPEYKQYLIDCEEKYGKPPEDLSISAWKD